MLFILSLLDGKLAIESADQRRASGNRGRIVDLSKDYTTCHRIQEQIEEVGYTDIEDMKTLARLIRGKVK